MRDVLMRTERRQKKRKGPWTAASIGIYFPTKYHNYLISQLLHGRDTLPSSLVPLVHHPSVTPRQNPPRLPARPPKDAAPLFALRSVLITAQQAATVSAPRHIPRLCLSCSCSLFRSGLSLPRLLPRKPSRFLARVYSICCSRHGSSYMFQLAFKTQIHRLNLVPFK